MENKMNELVQQLVEKLQDAHLQSIDSHPYFSVEGNDYGLLVDWSLKGLDLPDSIRIIEKNDVDGEIGYLGCIRFDVEGTSTNDLKEANFSFDEAEYDLTRNGERETLLEDLSKDIFS